MICPICFEDELLEVMSCTHSVCKECLPQVFLSGKCVLCRIPVNSISKRGKPQLLESITSEKFDTSQIEKTISEMRDAVQLLEKELRNYNDSYKDYTEKYERLKILSEKGYDQKLFSVIPPLPPKIESFSTQRVVQLVESFNYKEKSLYLNDFERQELIENFTNFICEQDSELIDVTTLKHVALPEEVNNGILDKFENRMFVVAKGFLTLFESDGEKFNILKSYPDEFNFENSCQQICAASQTDLIFTFLGYFLVFSFESGSFTTKGPLSNDRYLDCARIYPDRRIALLHQPNMHIWPYRQIDLDVRRFEIFY